MGNHCIDCNYCGNDLRSGGCASDCPGVEYERRLGEWRRLRADFIQNVCRLQREALEQAAKDASKLFEQECPAPREPPSYTSR